MIINMKYTIVILFLLMSSISQSQKISDYSETKDKVFVRVHQLDENILEILDTYGRIIDQKLEQITVKSNFKNNQGSKINYHWVVLEPTVDIEEIKNDDNVVFTHYFVQKKSHSLGITGVVSILYSFR